MTERSENYRMMCVDEWGIYLESVVGPRSEFQLALLIIEREPGDVDLAGAAEDAGRDVIAAAVAAHHHIRLVRAVEFLIGTFQMKFNKNSLMINFPIFKEKHEVDSIKKFPEFLVITTRSPNKF